VATLLINSDVIPIRKRPNQGGDRNTKFGRGGRAPARDGKRQYDRRSGTGRGREVKKGGGGARNWGSDKNEARQAEGLVDEDAVVPAAEEVTESKEDVAEIKEGEEETPVEEPEPEPEPEDKTMTYEEYLASKANPDNEAFKPVKERQVENEFAAMKVAKKVEEEDFMKVGGGKQKKTKQKKVTQKETIALDFRVASSSGDDRRNDGGDRGGRDGRGRGRGSRDGRVGGRGGRDGGRGGRDGGRGGRDGGRGGRDGGRGGRDAR
jgi:plasminogen activator inhibitor 1 RNA-binding protein